MKTIKQRRRDYRNTLFWVEKELEKEKQVLECVRLEAQEKMLRDFECSREVLHDEILPEYFIAAENYQKKRIEELERIRNIIHLRCEIIEHKEVRLEEKFQEAKKEANDNLTKRRAEIERELDERRIL